MSACATVAFYHIAAILCLFHDIIPASANTTSVHFEDLKLNVKPNVWPYDMRDPSWFECAVLTYRLSQACYWNHTSNHLYLDQTVGKFGNLMVGGKIWYLRVELALRLWLVLPRHFYFYIDKIRRWLFLESDIVSFGFSAPLGYWEWWWYCNEQRSYEFISAHDDSCDYDIHVFVMHWFEIFIFLEEVPGLGELHRMEHKKFSIQVTAKWLCTVAQYTAPIACFRVWTSTCRYGQSRPSHYV